MSDASVPETVSPPACPPDVDPAEWEQNLSEPASYSGVAPERSREVNVTTTADGEVMSRFREVLVRTGDLSWVEKSLAGLSHKMLWRNDETGASLALVRFERGAGIPSRHSHASNQFMFCLSGRYRYVPTGLVLTPGAFYWNPKGSLHGPTMADEDTILLEVYDGPHYPTQPKWYSRPEDAR